MSLSERSGVGPGDLVGLLIPPGPSFLDAVTDLWASGAAILPLDLRASPAELRSVLDIADPRVVESADGTHVRSAATPVSERTGLVIATSGTSGAPKLAELSKEAVTAAVHSSTRALGLVASTPWVACLSPAHVGGMLVYLRAALLGAPVIAHHRFDRERVAEAIEAQDEVCVSLVPTMLRQLVELGRQLAGATVLVGGGALERDVRASAEAAGARVVTTYGLTETTGGVVYDGRAFPGVDVRVMDDAIEVRSPTVMTGYRHDPGATANAFTTDGWLRTGDLGSIDDDGIVTVSGRVDDLIRTGAEKVWPEEVERALAGHPKVADVAVAGSPDPEWGEHVTAFVVPALIDDLPTLDELQRHLEGTLARFKFPRELVLYAEIPRTASGKIRRRDLR